MPVHRPGSPTRSHRSRKPVIAVLLTVLSLLLAFPTTAQAAEDIPPRGSAHMGMGVIEHDGEGPLPPGSPRAAAVQTEGVDVSSHQGNVNWASLWRSGVKWAYVKATEGTYYKNPYFAQQYNGSYNVGMIRGAYHFATPNTTSGAAQADYFVNNGGGWSRDGKTLPGALDIEWNPYGSQCFGKSQAGMVSWIWDFVNRYKTRTGRYPVIYTATSWWKTCTGNYSGFATNHPLWVARYNSTPGELPAGWSFYTMWQYTSSGPIVGDHNKFNGAYDRLQALANG
ncbi:lysozyme [Streptomyces sp. LHD-70]|uniref:lysozyme n=1 Tax=Streptomyces sp. LHD-70 TaxID=3072140 RepID=UPI00280CADDD|nr:lysozyme [Streptomyces sp. LHD-70]MDQ8702141.1 lysozyme [Streptomyces sp. LHD-70]